MLTEQTHTKWTKIIPKTTVALTAFHLITHFYIKELICLNKLFIVFVYLPIHSFTCKTTQ
jgi:hypothetical protein